eukprot:TRINITY_DN561_c0_g1_i2.p1 TRINITY_DN561_c0_g1~~TRINITY_DN561_c0_g1_i2.p1  ORF type:complete len:346 (-),score=80.40 TRINITY_DN561_c0_g1_i2:1220-2257(-)
MFVVKGNLVGNWLGAAGKRRYSSVSSSSTSKNVKNSKTLRDLFDENVAKYEHKDALRHVPGNVRWTYFEVQKEAIGFGNGLIFSKTRKGSKVTSLFNNELESLIVHLGAIKAGVVSSYAPSGLNEENIDHILKKIKPSGLVFNTKTTKVKEFDALVPELKWHNGPLNNPWQYPFLKYIWHSNRAHYNGMDWMRVYQMTNPDPDLLPWNDCDVSSSDAVVSNITIDGTEKSLTHEQVQSLVSEINKKLELGLHDRVCMAPSLSSLAGQVAGFWAPFLSGAVSVVPCVEFSVEDVVRAINVEKCNVLVGYEDQVNSILQHPKIKEHSILQRALIVSQDATPLRVVNV